jgi:hypothetical protein
LAGLELQPAYATLARRNAAENGVEMQVECGDLAQMPVALRRDFDHVIANPPYYPAGGTPSPNAARATALQVETPLGDWVQAAARRLAPGGWLTLICGADGVPAVLAAMGTKLGSASILPLQPREGRAALRIVLRARPTGVDGAWVQVRDPRSGQTLLNRVLRPGETWPVPPRAGLLLDTGKATELDILLDGQPQPTLEGVIGVRRNIALDPDRVRQRLIPAAAIPAPPPPAPGRG